MVFNPLNLCTATLWMLGTTAIAAHQFPKRWRQYLVSKSPSFMQAKINQLPNLKQSLWRTAFFTAAAGGILGPGLCSYSFFLEECVQAASFVAVVISFSLEKTLVYVVPAHQVPKDLFVTTLQRTHRFLDQFSALRKSGFILMLASVIMMVALWTLGRGHLTLDRLTSLQTQKGTDSAKSS